MMARQTNAHKLERGNEQQTQKCWNPPTHNGAGSTLTNPNGEGANLDAFFDDSAYRVLHVVGFKRGLS